VRVPVRVPVRVKPKVQSRAVALLVMARQSPLYDLILATPKASVWN
jgi:hypothetical protein